MDEKAICDRLGITEQKLDAWVQEAEDGSWLDDGYWSPTVSGNMDEATALRMMAEYGPGGAKHFEKPSSEAIAAQ
ncbi:hypothetical protein [Bifidobacterium sp. ESL0745]|uniref:hypothetical protein n=1 Tax=Bifidobacterium sp. ESL0745 TaxID=2983226 RepID=UPI0023F86EB8|nr:hypothetical protein [Bifidobacterium sp. ESL0745]MDF7665669.1 hypothetical protein [Bifidobacterium sp. ESL0745]